MNKDFRDTLIKEIARKVDTNCSLEWIISKYNEKYSDLKVSEKDFSIRVANTPAEACYCSTIITIPKNEEIFNKDAVIDMVIRYDKLLTNAFNNHNEIMKPSNIENLTWDDLRELL